MSYTHPNGQPQGCPLYFTNRIREALVAEVIAINGYAEHIANSDMQQINTVWQHIIKDEKDHYGMLLTLLRKYDPEQYHAYTLHAQDTFQPEPIQDYQPEYNKQIILNNIREDIKGEYEAVVLYEQMIMEAPYQDVKDVFHQIIPMEKEHAEHLTKILMYFDADQYDGLT